MDKVQHFEIPASDMVRAKKFYSDVFGWSMVEYPMPEMKYTSIYTAEVDEKHMPKEVGVINGGMPERTPVVQHPTIAVTVKNIDQTIEKIKKSGGSVAQEKMKVGDMGWYAYIKDTEGNVIGVWQTLK